MTTGPSSTAFQTTRSRKTRLLNPGPRFQNCSWIEVVGQAAVALLVSEYFRKFMSFTEELANRNSKIKPRPFDACGHSIR